MLVIFQNAVGPALADGRHNAPLVRCDAQQLGHGVVPEEAVVRDGILPEGPLAAVEH